MPEPHLSPGIACVLLAAALTLLPATAEADSQRRIYRPTGRDRSLAASDTLGEIFFSERQRRAARTRRVAAQAPAAATSPSRTVEDWLSLWGEVDSRATR